MEENSTIRNRQTRQMIGELNRIGGIVPKTDQTSTTAKPLGSELQTMSGPLKIKSSHFHRDDKRQPQLLGVELGRASTNKMSKNNLLMRSRIAIKQKSEIFPVWNYPEGLEYLVTLSSLFIVQEIESLDLMTGIEANMLSRYVVQNIDGERLFFAMEESKIISKLCLCSRRPFKVLVFNNENKHIMTVDRPYNCCFQKANVFAPPNACIGCVEQKFTWVGSLFFIKNSRGDVLQKLRGPKFAFLRCHPAEFDVLSKDGQTKLGIISTNWEALSEEQAIDSHCLGIVFPDDLDCETKALLLGAMFLLNIVIYESSTSIA